MKKLLTLFFSMSILFAFAQERAAGPDKTDQSGGSRDCVGFVMTSLASPSLDEDDLVQEILGPGMTYSGVSYTGNDVAAGKFTGGIAAGISMESGVVMSSGSLNNAIGPNEEENISRNNNEPGDADLTALAGEPTYDASVLEFDFNPGANTAIFIQFVFGSDEYTEYVNSEYNDVFAFYLNGTNIALIPSTTTPVSVNTINHLTNSAYYIDNDPPDWWWQPDATYCTEMDGFTVVLTATGSINPNVDNHIKFAIADASDEIYDAWVFIKTQGFTPIEEDHADLGIMKTASPEPWYFGDNVTYTITVHNYGPDAATGVLVTDLLSAGLQFVSFTATQGSNSFPTPPNWTVGNLANGATATGTLVAKILDNGGPWDNLAQVESNEDDPTNTNNQSPAIIEPETSPEVPIGNWALYLGIGLIVAFTVIRFRRIL